jgi:lipopolysaccharide heptosyltransferase I
MNASPKILIIRLSSLGDILHVLPAFASLRQSFPESKIEWLAAKKSAFLLRAVPGIDRLHLLDTTSLLRVPVDRSAWGETRALIRVLRARRFDFAIDFQGLLKTAILGRMTGSRTRFGFSRELVREHPAHWFYHQSLKKPSQPVHVLELNQMLAELAGARRVSVPLEFSISEEDGHVSDWLLNDAQFREFIVMNPGGGWPTKRWDPAKYGLLAKKIQAELGIRVIVTTGPGEDELYKTIAAHCGEPAPLHSAVSFLQLIPLLKKARLFIGGDTGPFHLACAVGTAVVGVFGPTFPVRNGPWGNEDEVVSRNLPCSGCYGRTCPTQNECMDMTVEEVYAGAVRRMKSRKGISVEKP